MSRLEQKFDLDGDWMSFIQSVPSSSREEIELAAMATGDHTLIKTQNTAYLLTWNDGESAELRTNSEKAPSGPVRIMGCSFGLSSSIRPHAIFCGGNLEFTYQQGDKTWTTSKIDAIYHLRRSENILKRP